MNLNKSMQNKNEIKKYFFEIPNFLSIFIFTIYFLLLSPILLDISNDIGIDPSNFIIVVTLYTIGAIFGQLTSFLYGRIIKRLYAMITGYILLSLVTMILFWSRKIIIFYILYFIAGYILGIIYIQAVTSVFESPVKNKDRLTTIALTFYPLGAFIAPISASSIVLNNYSWRYIYIFLLFFILITLILLLLKVKKNSKNIITNDDKNIYAFKGIFHNRRNNILLFIISFSLVIYVIAETIISTWFPTYYRLIRIWDVQSAGFIVSIFWISIIIGRILVSLLTGKIKISLIMIVLASIASISIAFSIFLKTQNSIYIAIFFSGLGCSGLFPLLISSGSKIFDKGKDIIAVILFTSGNIGVTLAPLLIRETSKISMKFSVLVALFSITAALILLILHYLFKKNC